MSKERPERPGREERRRERRVAGEQGGKIAHTLMGLKEADLDQLSLDEDLRWEVDQARRVTSMNARRREERRLAGVLRSYDLEALAAKLAAQQQAGGADARLFKMAESWRDRLIDGESLERFLSELARQKDPGDLAENHFSGNDAQTWHRLVNEARRERNSGKPKGAGKRLFRAIRAAIDDSRGAEQ
jgi:ribosome-associated protein